jgi:hypothetical protein
LFQPTDFGIYHFSLGKVEVSCLEEELLGHLLTSNLVHVDEVAELSPHASHRTVVVLARNGPVVLGQCPKPHETILEAELLTDFRGRDERNKRRRYKRLDLSNPLRLGDNVLNFLYIPFSGRDHHF